MGPRRSPLSGGFIRNQPDHQKEFILVLLAPRPLKFTPDNEPHWVRLCVHQIEDGLATVLVADDAPLSERGTLKGLAFFGATPDEAERVAKAYLGLSEPKN